MQADQFDEAIRIAGRGIAIAHATGWPSQAGAALQIVALAHRWKGELDEALQAIHESVRLLEPAPGETRTGRMQPYTLALIREGQILGEDQAISLNRPEEAAECLQRALEIARRFAQQDASDFASHYRVYTAETKLAGILRHTDPSRSLELYDDGLRQITAASANAGAIRNEAETLAASVYPLLRLGRRAEARKRLDAAFERLRRLKQYPSGQIAPGSLADYTLRALAEYEAAGGRFQAASDGYQELVRLILAGNPQPATSLEDAVDLSNLYTAAARVHRRAGRPGFASDLQTRRLELWQSWSVKLSHSAFVRRQLDDSRRHQHHL
jgi:tetratricopeptide (TPR) repeat protein